METDYRIFVSGQRELSSFTDTLGTNPFALTSTSGAYPNPVSFAYNNSSGTQASPFYKSFANYTVQTGIWMFEHHRLIPPRILGCWTG